jgi:serine/threonine-protein kinase
VEGVFSADLDNGADVAVEVNMTSLASTADVEPVGEGHVIAGKYRLERLLGEGGMGTIWRAYNLQLEVPVALKLLRAGMNAAELGERLRVEARAAAKLVHPSIVRVFDIGEAESGEPFIVMELLQGQTLGEMLERGPLSAVNALQLLLPIGEALSLAHSRGVVHRDLKPDNIFIASEGSCLQPKLLDFGIAKVRSRMVDSGPTVTQSGTLLGSPEYMSPEQAHGRADIDERSDIWAFCVVLYEAIAGRPPFEGETCQAILQSVLQDEPFPLERCNEVDPELAALIHWGLAKDRDARPASMFDLGRELAAWLFVRGLLEDATGSSLEAKWLGRTEETDSLSAAQGIRSPRAQHEHATLVSVVHPSPHPSYDSLDEAPSRGRRRWVASAAVATVALAGCLGWASVHGLRSASRVASATSIREPARAAAVPAMTAALPVRTKVVTVDASPVSPGAPPAPSAAGLKAYGPARSWIAAKSASPPANDDTPSAEATPAPRALPQALPARENQVELINPY